eukprot:93040-Pelagomonas_calceolata.AAC.2
MLPLTSSSSSSSVPPSIEVWLCLHYPWPFARSASTHFDRVYCGKCKATFLFEQVPGAAKKPAPKSAAAAPEPEPAAPSKGGKKGKE